MASPFSGSAGRKAGMWAIGQAMQNFDAGNKIIGDARQNALSALGQGMDRGIASLEGGYAAARPEFSQAIDRYEPWAEAGRGALRTYQNSLGLGGAAGNDSAVAAFQASPGYQWQQDQAADQIARKQSATGALGSGNTLVALQDRAQNIANQEYGGWQDRLNGLSNTGLAATGQQAGIQTQLGALNAQQGRDRAGIYTGTAGQEAGLEGTYAGMGLSNLGKMSDTVIGAGTGAMLAGQQAAQNRLNFGMQGLQLGASLLGGAMGGGGGMGGLFGGSGMASNALGGMTGFSPFARNM